MRKIFDVIDGDDYLLSCDMQFDRNGTLFFSDEDGYKKHLREDVLNYSLYFTFDNEWKFNQLQFSTVSSNDYDDVGLYQHTFYKDLIFSYKQERYSYTPEQMSVLPNYLVNYFENHILVYKKVLYEIAKIFNVEKVTDIDFKLLYEKINQNSNN